MFRKQSVTILVLAKIKTEKHRNGNARSGETVVRSGPDFLMRPGT